MVQLVKQNADNVTKRLRDSIVDTVNEVVDKRLAESQIYQDAGSGYVTIEALCKKVR